MDESVQEKITVGLDLSTTCTGFAAFKGDQLVEHGTMKATSVGMSKMGKYEKLLERMERLVYQIEVKLLKYKPDLIVIEEIAGSKNRLGQKTLDGFHFVVLKRLREIEMLDRVVFYDVTGAKGWRTHLKLKLTDADKANNKEAKKLNKKLAKGTKKLPIIGPKHLSARYVNSKFGMNLDVDENTTDADVADAVAMTDAFLIFTKAQF